MIIKNRKNRNLSLLTTSLLGGLAMVQNVGADTEVTLPASVLTKIQEAERTGVTR